MVLADWIAVGIVAGGLLLGALVGFGSGLKFFTKGIFGFIIAIVVCALVGTVFLEVGFIGDLMRKFSSLWTEKEGWFYDFLGKIHMEVVVYYIVLFIVVQILRIIIVGIIKGISRSKNIVIRTLDRAFGAIFFALMFALIALLILKIIGWVGGTTATELYDSLTGSLFRLDALFDRINPDWQGITG